MSDYNRVNWTNNTPINTGNLNNMDAQIKQNADDIDELKKGGGDAWEEIPSSKVTVTKSGSSSYFTITLPSSGRGIVDAVAIRIPFDIQPEEVLDETRGIVLCAPDYGGTMTIKTIYNKSGVNVNTQMQGTIQFAITTSLSDRQRDEARFFIKKII